MFAEDWYFLSQRLVYIVDLPVRMTKIGMRLLTIDNHNLPKPYIAFAKIGNIRKDCHSFNEDLP